MECSTIFTNTLTILTHANRCHHHHHHHQVIYVQSLVGVLMMGKLMRKVRQKQTLNTFDAYLKRHELTHRIVCLFVWPNLTDIFWNAATSRIRAFDGALLVCSHRNMLGIYRLSRWLQSEICCTFHRAAVFKIIPLAGRGTSRLRMYNATARPAPFCVCFISHSNLLFINSNRWNEVQWLAFYSICECQPF